MSSMSRARARGIRVAIVTAATGVFGLLASPAWATIRFLQAEAATALLGSCTRATAPKKGHDYG